MPAGATAVAASISTDHPTLNVTVDDVRPGAAESLSASPTVGFLQPEHWRQWFGHRTKCVCSGKCCFKPCASRQVAPHRSLVRAVVHAARGALLCNGRYGCNRQTYGSATSRPDACHPARAMGAIGGRVWGYRVTRLCKVKNPCPPKRATSQRNTISSTL